MSDDVVALDRTTAGRGTGAAAVRDGAALGKERDTSYTVCAPIATSTSAYHLSGLSSSYLTATCRCICPSRPLSPLVLTPPL